MEKTPSRAVLSAPVVFVFPPELAMFDTAATVSAAVAYWPRLNSIDAWLPKLTAANLMPDGGTVVLYSD